MDEKKVVTIKADVFETNSDIEVGPHFNHVAKVSLVLPGHELDYNLFVVFLSHEGPGKGRMFVHQDEARKLFRAVQSNLAAWEDKAINGKSVAELNTWIESMTPEQLIETFRPEVVDKYVVSLDIAGVQVVNTNGGFKLLELLGANETGVRFIGNEDPFFTVVVYLHDHSNEEAVYLRIKDKNGIVPVMEKLKDLWIDVRLEVTSTEQLLELLGDES